MQRIVEHAREDFELPPGSSDDYVLVEVTMFAGRSRQATRLLYQALVDNLGELGVAPTDVFVVLQEPPLDNWAIRGGQMASEVDLGLRSTSDQPHHALGVSSGPTRHRLRRSPPERSSQPSYRNVLVEVVYNVGVGRSSRSSSPPCGYPAAGSEPSIRMKL